MAEKERIHAGQIDAAEKERWKRQMVIDGFHRLWTWICWIIRNHIKNYNEEE